MDTNDTNNMVLLDCFIEQLLSRLACVIYPDHWVWFLCSWRKLHNSVSINFHKYAYKRAATMNIHITDADIDQFLNATKCLGAIVTRTVFECMDIRLNAKMK